MRPSSARGRTAPSWSARTQQLLTERDLTLRAPETFVAWDSRRAAPWPITLSAGMPRTTWPRPRGHLYLHPRRRDNGAMPTRPGAAPGVGRPVCPGRSEALTWVPAADVRRAVRMFTAEQPSCYTSWGWGSKSTPMPRRPAGPCLCSMPSPASSIGAAATCSSPSRHQFPVGRGAAAQGAGLPHARLCRAPPGTAGHRWAGNRLRHVSRQS